MEAVDQPPFLFALFSNEVAEISPSGWPWSVGHIQQFGQRPSGPPEGAWENLGDFSSRFGTKFGFPGWEGWDGDCAASH